MLSVNDVLMFKCLSSFTLSVCISLTSVKHYKSQRVVNVNRGEGNTREGEKVKPGRESKTWKSEYNKKAEEEQEVL